MTLKENLTFLKEKGACDSETSAILLQNANPFIESQVASSAETLRTSEYSEAYEEGKKLLFLEELIAKPPKTQQKIEQWLQDQRRSKLFSESEQSDIYGELLVARAESTLPEYRQEYFPDSQEQEPYTFSENLELTLTEYARHPESFSLKVNALISRLLQEAKPPMEEFKELRKLRQNIFGRNGTSGWEREKGRDYTQRDVEEFVRICKIIESEIKLDTIQTDEGQKYSIDGEIKDTLGPLGEIDEIDMMYFKEPSSLGGWYRELMFEFREELRVYKEYYKKCKEIEENLLSDNPQTHPICIFDEIPQLFEYAIGNNTIKYREYESEIEALSELGKAISKASDKFKPGQRLRYFLSLSEKDPLDVTFGNDGGCCVGVYTREDSNIGNAYGLPHMISDNATYIFNVMQRREKSKRKRTGMVLAFDARDEKGNRILVCNSIELSPAMNPTETLERLVGYVEKGLVNFAQRNDFQAVVMGAHDYNTSWNYSSRKARITEEIFKKVRKDAEPEFYSEVFDEEGTSDELFYVLWDERKTT